MSETSHLNINTTFMKMAGSVTKGKRPSVTLEPKQPRRGSQGPRWQGPLLRSALAGTCFCPTEVSGGDDRLHGGLGDVPGEAGPHEPPRALGLPGWEEAPAAAGEVAPCEPSCQDEA